MLLKRSIRLIWILAIMHGSFCDHHLLNISTLIELVFFLTICLIEHSVAISSKNPIQGFCIFCNYLIQLTYRVSYLKVVVVKGFDVLDICDASF